MSDVERLHFKIGLSGTYWDKVPKYTILVNDTEYGEGYISEQPGNLQFFEFDADVPEGPAVLKIRLENKTDADVVKDNNDSEDFTIVKDMLLSIRSVEINEVNLGELLWSCSTFVGDDTARPTLERCVDLGWNGTWQLKFDSPFYIWVLENI
jgi:hypothetical protein